MAPTGNNISDKEASVESLLDTCSSIEQLYLRDFTTQERKVGDLIKGLGDILVGIAVYKEDLKVVISNKDYAFSDLEKYQKIQSQHVDCIIAVTLGYRVGNGAKLLDAVMPIVLQVKGQLETLDAMLSNIIDDIFDNMMPEAHKKELVGSFSSSDLKTLNS